MSAFARPCLGCGQLTRLGNRCIQCQKSWNQSRHVKGPRPYDKPEWKRASAKKRSDQPWCSMCGRQDDLTVDHIIPLSKGGDLVPDDDELLRVLCRRCHGKVTIHKEPRAHECA